MRPGAFIGPVRSTRAGRAGEQGRVVPRDYGSFACPGRCPALPYRMGQGATLGGTRGETRTHTGIPFEGMASTD